MSLFKNTLTALTLTVATFGTGLEAGSSNPDRAAAAAEIVWANHSGASFDFENDFAPQLLRGDADLFTYSSNPGRYSAVFEYEVVQNRYIYCTVTCEVEETLGSTKFSFPSTSRLVFDAGPGWTINAFDVEGGNERIYSDYAVIQSRRNDYNWNGHVPATIRMGALKIRGDRWGNDRDMFWDMHGRIYNVTIFKPKYTNAQLDAMFPPTSRNLVTAGNRFFRSFR
jgi:hypothetical protein